MFHTTALIMAGGCGERFWPKSRKKLPKQFLSLTGDGKTMIQLTVNRILPLVNMDDIYISTNESYRALVKEQLPDIPDRNILCEPVGRNTAPCIGWGAKHILKKYPDAVMIVLPSDHLIKQEKLYQHVLRDACAVAEQGENLVTIGIAPTYPETGYGYIKFEDLEIGGGYKVAQFVEKPDLETAQKYIDSQRYLWNSGMFVWKASTIIHQFERYLPQAAQGLDRISDAIGTPNEKEVLDAEFPNLPSVSIDYGIMEKADNIYIFPGSFGWDDVGSWLALARINRVDAQGNVLKGNILTVDSENCIMDAQRPGHMVVAVGLQDAIIVDTEDATLICDKSDTAKIKKAIETMKQNPSMSKYL